ncbi:MarR family winged helix-turn-helix transcriptional regulator [Streptomyces sp. NPDC053429]|uniref:MarR family winged helix-turn-helix transcriptional regulator n=1 Tax=Streptomyces sp. NPDC053429 TaxID=3365702 RepID=UPI0037D3F369
MRTFERDAAGQEVVRRIGESVTLSHGYDVLGRMIKLVRSAAELMQLSSDLEKADILLELLTGPLTGVYDPNGMGAMFFAVLAAAQIERYIPEKMLESQQIAAARGNHGGRPKVIDDDMPTFVLALKAKNLPVPEIAGKLVIKTGKNAGRNPSVASVYRALADAEDAERAGVADSGRHGRLVTQRTGPPLETPRSLSPLTAVRLLLRSTSALGGQHSCCLDNSCLGMHAGGVTAPTSGLRDHLGYWLRRLSDEVHARFERQLAEHGVTVSQWTVLITVYRGDATTTREVARYANIDAGAVSRLVDRLIAKGLIFREPDLGSRRILRLTLTDAGRDLAPRLAEIADRNDAYFFAHLDPDQRLQLEEWIRRLVGETHPEPPTPPLL